MITRVGPVSQHITQEINTLFHQRVVSLILYGSAKYTHKPEDIDLELLLDSPDENDFLVLNHILAKFRQKIELHISYQSQLIKLKHFRRKAQGSYLLYSLSQGILLLGRENYYQKLLRKADHITYIKDLIIKSQEYQYSLREFLVEKDLANKKNKFIKHLVRYISQLMLLNNELTYTEILKLTNPGLAKRILKCVSFSNQYGFLLKKIFGSKNISQEEFIIISTKLLFYTDELLQEQYQKFYD